MKRAMKALFVTFIFFIYKGSAFNHLVEGPNIGFARCEMRAKMKAEYGMTELLMAGCGIKIFR